MILLEVIQTNLSLSKTVNLILIVPPFAATTAIKHLWKLPVKLFHSWGEMEIWDEITLFNVISIRFKFILWLSHSTIIILFFEPWSCWFALGRSSAAEPNWSWVVTYSPTEFISIEQNSCFCHGKSHMFPWSSPKPWHSYGTVGLMLFFWNVFLVLCLM